MDRKSDTSREEITEEKYSYFHPKRIYERHFGGKTFGDRLGRVTGMALGWNVGGITALSLYVLGVTTGESFSPGFTRDYLNILQWGTLGALLGGLFVGGEIGTDVGHEYLGKPLEKRINELWK